MVMAPWCFSPGWSTSILGVSTGFVPLRPGAYGSPTGVGIPVAHGDEWGYNHASAASRATVTHGPSRPGPSVPPGRSRPVGTGRRIARPARTAESPRSLPTLSSTAPGVRRAARAACRVPGRACSPPEATPCPRTLPTSPPTSPPVRPPIRWSASAPTSPRPGRRCAPCGGTSRPSTSRTSPPTG